MPEAAVDEYGQPAGWEDKVGADFVGASFSESINGVAGQRIQPDRNMAPPARDPVRLHQCDKRQFGVTIAAPPDPGHDLGSLGLAENIRHRDFTDGSKREWRQRDAWRPPDDQRFRG